MSALATGEAERLLRFVAEAGEDGGDEPVTPELLTGLGTLARADWVGHSGGNGARCSRPSARRTNSIP
jgi:hypothetical protein